ncbi:cysteine-rich receptor-like protein kinase 10-like protein [Corchorus olitorius]|uniref:Cysteine-rich receptor-like protein kinase 10-like protein n=1 Tax=Corchorus olitorius TaxID=93759 RepID=A0A1R3GC87_9ROSI|nr:cysteine-rich receptor-like protein kinase 10-like protein [Corchorus olitorius]
MEETTSMVLESLQFDLDTIKAAANNFSSDNKIGEGGFCEVYKEDPANRPTMTRLLLMLDSYSVSLPIPQKPAFSCRTGTGSNLQAKGLESSDQSSSTKSTPVYQ